MDWRTHLTDLIDTGTFRTQRELVRALEARVGRRMNQATISRELRTLGARKVDGVYRTEQEFALEAHLHDVASTAGGCLVVVRTDLAYASVVAQKVDAAALPGVLGTIAGDDTVFVATTGPQVLPSLYALLGWRS
jgi:transcriptional regulator of arginine metabolism